MKTKTTLTILALCIICTSIQIAGCVESEMTSGKDWANLTVGKEEYSNDHTPEIDIKYPEIQGFLDNLTECDWCVACGSYARYTRMQAEDQGIELYETTIKDNDPNRIKRTVMSGHQLNCFYAEDGHKVYVDNTHNWGIILEGHELKDHIKDKFGIDM